MLLALHGRQHIYLQRNIMCSRWRCTSLAVSGEAWCHECGWCAAGEGHDLQVVGMNSHRIFLWRCKWSEDVFVTKYLQSDQGDIWWNMPKRFWAYNIKTMKLQTFLGRYVMGCEKLPPTQPTPLRRSMSASCKKRRHLCMLLKVIHKIEWWSCKLRAIMEVV